ncbi:hypothetical protein GOODEAATRI_026757 [Goodea atripinnis]|uniref:Uncharacterized protein n=1 Tax=Goodea atripinnis TaxID=208336 RepID=A0ABV0Q1A9_9TELE
MPIVHDRNAVSRMIYFVGPMTQAFALMTRELGRTLSMLVHAQHQVWLAHSSLTKPCRTLRALPVVPGELLGSRTRQQLVGSIDLPVGLLLLGQRQARCQGPSPLLFISWGPQAWLLDRDQLRPRGTMVGPRLPTQFEPLNLVAVSPGLLGAGGPAASTAVVRIAPLKPPHQIPAFID